MALADLLTRSPGDVAKEQFKKLYLRLYPYIIGDFHHKEDINIALESIKLELIEIKSILTGHTHSAETGTTGPAIVPAPPVSPTVLATSAIANSLLIPGGAIQPTGAGISFQPSRLDAFPAAIPPLNPLEPSV